MELDAAGAVANALAWFESNSGWAPPDGDTLAEWLADGVCRCPDDCLVTPRGWCGHGLASWWLVLAAVDGPDALPVPAPGAPGLAPDASAALHPDPLGSAPPRRDRLDPGRPDYDAVMSAHRRAVERGESAYVDPLSGLLVMTARYLADRGLCCASGCRHCPYPP